MQTDPVWCITDTPTPTIDAIYATAALLTKTLGDRRGRLEIQPA
jgi:2-dehydropantoate 2-reductase